MKKYGVIYADPPWHYRVWSQKGAGRSAEAHYPTMSMEAIKAWPVGDLAAKDCALFLWLTLPLLYEGWAVMQAWGFVYKTVAFVWVKQNKKADSLFTLPVIQSAILENAAGYVRPGGTLLYSTCTILPEENEEVTDALLGLHPEFSRERFTLPGDIGQVEGQATLWPHLHDTDGFYICRMTRRV